MDKGPYREALDNDREYNDHVGDGLDKRNDLNVPWERERERAMLMPPLSPPQVITDIAPFENSNHCDSAFTGAAMQPRRIIRTSGIAIRPSPRKLALRSIPISIKPMIKKRIAFKKSSISSQNEKSWLFVFSDIA